MKGQANGRDLQIRPSIFLLLLTEYTKPPSELKDIKFERENEVHTVCYALSYGQFQYRLHLYL